MLVTGTRDLDPNANSDVTTNVQGTLTLVGDPTQPLEATTKGYVDSRFDNLNAANLVSGLVNVDALPGFTGDVTSSDGSNSLTLVSTGVSSGTYTKVTVDSKGRVTGGATLTESDIPSLNWSKVTSGVPTTLAGYGIVDGLSVYGGTLSSNLTVTGDTSGNRDAVTKGYVDGFQVTGTVETGVVMKRAVSSAVIGYLRANGADVSKTTYSDLYNVIGDAFTPNRTLTTNDGHRIGSGKPWKQQWDINNTSGNMGSWRTESNTLPEILTYSQAVVTSSRVYLLGGSSSHGPTNKVYSAPINSDGTIGAWVIESNTLPGVLDYSQAIVTSSRVYLLGGKANNNNVTSMVYSAPINSDGTIGTWSSESRDLDDRLALSQAIVTSSRVYLLGGFMDSRYKTGRVYVAAINSDGTLGSWSDAAYGVPDSLDRSQAVVTGSRVYLLGGISDDDGVTNKVYSAPIDSDGIIGNWRTESSHIPNNLASSQVVVTSSRVYLLGGYDGREIDEVYSAPINSDGTIGTWTTESITLPEGLYWSQAVVTSSRVYLLGGCNSSGSKYTDKICSAPFTGGLNDYMPFITAPIGSTSVTTYPDDKFRLPDYSSEEQLGEYYFIKY